MNIRSKLIGPAITERKRHAQIQAEEVKPIFPDLELDRICRAFNDGDFEKFGELLRQYGWRFKANTKLLADTISHASGAAYKAEERIVCIRLLLESGFLTRQPRKAGRCAEAYPVAGDQTGALGRVCRPGRSRRRPGFQPPDREVIQSLVPNGGEALFTRRIFHTRGF